LGEIWHRRRQIRVDLVGGGAPPRASGSSAGGRWEASLFEIHRTNGRQSFWTNETGVP